MSHACVIFLLANSRFFSAEFQASVLVLLLFLFVFNLLKTRIGEKVLVNFLFFIVFVWMSGHKSQESSRRNSLQALASSSVSELTEDRVGEIIEQKLALALGPLMQQLSASPQPLSQASQSLSQAAQPVSQASQPSSQVSHADRGNGDMMQQVMDMVEASLNDRGEAKHVRRRGVSGSLSRPARASSSRSRAFYSDPVSAEEEVGFLEDEDGRLVPFALSVLNSEASAVAWVRAQSCFDARSRKEAHQWATLIDTFRAEKLNQESAVLEIAVRRLIGLHLSTLHSNWELAEVLEWSGGQSLLSRGQLSRVIKEANARSALAKRAAYSGGHGGGGHGGGGRGGGHGGHGKTGAPKGGSAAP